MPSLSEIQGYNRFLLAFWLSDRGAVDNALFWSSLTSAERQAIKTEYNAAGVAIMVSAFGSTGMSSFQRPERSADKLALLIDKPTTAGVDPTVCAKSLAAFVKTNDLDGVDVDYEDSSFNTGTAEAWLISTSKLHLSLFRYGLIRVVVFSFPDSPEARAPCALHHLSCPPGALVYFHGTVYRRRIYKGSSSCRGWYRFLQRMSSTSIPA